MIPSDHFVRFYNEVFKYLSAKGTNELGRYYKRVSENQEAHCLSLFRDKRLEGMFEYWEKIRIEENCDMTHGVNDGCYSFRFSGCPSLGKVIDNDAEPCSKYCDHCPGWILPIMSKVGAYAVYNIMDRKKPCCEMYVYLDKDRAAAKASELGRRYAEDVILTNFDQGGLEK
ncbi:MAG: hypothetical protein IKJ45_16750 [Kiritimatiellae bacterium]|nr:hypothetical protein [Kiritimatiellia bacterium]